MAATKAEDVCLDGYYEARLADNHSELDIEAEKCQEARPQAGGNAGSDGAVASHPSESGVRLLDVVDGDEDASLEGPSHLSCRDVLRIMGPGIMVCLADTDGPCLITAAQSGAIFAYSLLLTQLVLIPVLYMAQELTVRLGLYARRGMTELVRERYGAKMAYAVCGLVVIICVGAIISEIVCISQVGEMYGVPLWISCVATVVVLGLIVVTGGYKTVEKVGVLLGAFQFVFLPLIFLTKPNWHDVWISLWDYGPIIHSTDKEADISEFMGLLAANIGAVIMPWMLFYQQSAICDKTTLRKCKSHLKLARVDTGVGALLTQLVMAAMVISVAAATANKGLSGQDRKIQQVQDIITRMEDYCGGPVAAKFILSCGMVGASLVASLVVSLCGAWAMAEAAGAPRSLDMSIRTAPTFYIGYFVVLCGSVATTLIVGKEAAVKFNIGVQVLNALTMPAVIGILFVLASSRDVLPDEVRLQGWYKWAVLAVFMIVSVFSVWAAVTGNVSG